MISWNDLTRLGDSVVMMPAAVMIVAWLLSARAGRLALCWCLMFGGALACVLATKIAFIGWGLGIRVLDFTGLSGHAMRACAVLPVLAYLTLRHAPPGWRIAGLALGGVLAALVGISRVVVHAHTISEAVGGCLLGALVSLSFIRLCQTRPTLALPRWLLALGLLALLPTAQASPAPTNGWVNGIALYLSGRERPYRRDDWPGRIGRRAERSFLTSPAIPVSKQIRQRAP